MPYIGVAKKAMKVCAQQRGSPTRKPTNSKDRRWTFGLFYWPTSCSPVRPHHIWAELSSDINFIPFLELKKYNRRLEVLDIHTRNDVVRSTFVIGWEQIMRLGRGVLRQDGPGVLILGPGV